MSEGQINFREYPKVELHRHLEGAVRFSSLIELRKSLGLEVPAELAQQRAEYLVLKPMKDLAAVIHAFGSTQQIFRSEEIITRITYECIEDAANEGIRILELRYAPTFMRLGHEHLSFEKIHRAILRGVAMAKDLPIAVGLICILQRTLPLKESEKVLDFALECKNTWVGFDLADDEDSGPANQFQKLFERVQNAGVPITIHAGETPSPTSPLNVKDSIKLLGARRIGHGLQIINNLEILNFVRDQKIPLEISVTSNWLTNAITSVDAHPIRKLINAGVLVTLNSDDPGIFGIDLPHEYELLATRYSFTKAEFDHLNDIAARASFIPLAEKQKHWPRPIQ
ncbi:MAG: adenosine deaminase [Oligoflexia bacterium]|nr:MAG: adenosine deaminase [Oligoflexia bacterium]